MTGMGRRKTKNQGGSMWIDYPPANDTLSRVAAVVYRHYGIVLSQEARGEIGAAIASAAPPDNK